MTDMNSKNTMQSIEHAELIEIDDPRWLLTLNRCRHEIYHIPEYTALEAKRQNAEACALFYTNADNDILLIPLIIRNVTVAGRLVIQGLRDAVSPYGYSGLLVDAPKCCISDFINRALDFSLDVLIERKICSIFIRLNPILNSCEWFCGRGLLVEHGKTVWLNLRLTTSELQQQTRSSYRNNVNMARRRGALVCFDEGWDRLDDFIVLYHRTMNRVSASSFYYFDKLYFLGLKQALGVHLKLCVVELNGSLVAAGLFGICGGIVQYLFSCKDDSSLVPEATKLMLIFVRDWAKLHGFTEFHLGGGVGAAIDSLLHFKQGFSDLTYQFFTWRFIVSATDYHQALEKWIQISGKTPDSLSGYFPAYWKEITDPFANEE